VKNSCFEDIIKVSSSIAFGLLPVIDFALLDIGVMSAAYLESAICWAIS